MASSVSSTSLSGLGLSGLSSGLDTSGIITKLMAVESGPQTALKATLSSATTTRTALQSLNTSVAQITSTATAAAKSNALKSFTATSDTASVTASASSTASAQSVSFTVDAIAKAQVTVTDAMTTWDTAAAPSITIRSDVNGTTPTDRTVTFTSSNLDDVVAQINAAGTGVVATKIAAGKDAAGAAQYRLQLRSGTGDASAFAVSTGTAYSATAAVGTKISSAADAQVTLYGGTAAQQVVKSSTNTFDDLLTGVDVTVSAVTTASATVSVGADSTAATTAAQTLTSSLVALFSGIAAASAITTGSSSSGSTSATSGSIFTGDSGVRALKDALLGAVSDPVGNRSPSSIGINLTKDGTITFDSAKFATAMQDDPAGTTAMFQTIAGRVADKGSAVSDSISGTLTKRITAQQGTESTLTKEISDWDTRLATIQAQYTAQFNALETALQSLSSQASYLTSQISGLTTNYQSTS